MAFGGIGQLLFRALWEWFQWNLRFEASLRGKKRDAFIEYIGWLNCADDAARVIYNYLFSAVPYRTGRLRRSIDVRVQGTIILISYIFYLPPLQAKLRRNYLQEATSLPALRNIARDCARTTAFSLPDDDDDE